MEARLFRFHNSVMAFIQFNKEKVCSPATAVDRVYSSKGALSGDGKRTSADFSCGFLMESESGYMPNFLA